MGVAGITSVNTNVFSRRSMANTLWDMQQSYSPFPIPLIVYYDGDRPPPEHPHTTCRINVTEVEPWTLAWLRNHVEMLDMFHSRIRDEVWGEQHNMMRRIDDAADKLVFKVAAIHHAVHTWHAAARMCIWLDVDVLVLRPPDSRFFEFASSHDVATIARMPMYHVRPETGIISFSLNKRSQRFTTHMRDLYTQGLVALALQCSEGALYPPVQPVCPL